MSARKNTSPTHGSMSEAEIEEALDDMLKRGMPPLLVRVLIDAARDGVIRATTKKRPGRWGSDIVWKSLIYREGEE